MKRILRDFNIRIETKMIVILAFIIIFKSLYYCDISLPLKLSQFIRVSYIANWQDLGICSRAFLGTILYPLNEVSDELIFWIWFIINILEIILVLKILHHVLCKVSNKHELFILLLLMFCFPIARHFTFYNIGATDTYLLLMGIICILMIFQKSVTVKFLSVIPLLIGIAIHSIMIFAIIPAIVIILIDKLYCEKRNIKYVFAFAIPYMLILFLFFVKFQFFRDMAMSEIDCISYFNIKWGGV